ncbi:sigma-54 dependent transcriptional regulator [Glaciimonas sp. CA11.2]|uniref:sigma-54-dependent transcriptional regulator n=1 Tax=Glaciimonas sp. CA11.2 TaxID=3048601 RepID=UPI002AB560F3|nr:sigma-54 dependent transcriptional regulator [Glaciimonas sp. CA11.2]MDY7545627.1 sigma-54 dependent transcriptional regulator [Glaciimonas sp. CA11.2]MEB0162470.1 sigma-54 dependent transcriptional regulator [Glaciimonas sp. CA11.2]
MTSPRILVVDDEAHLRELLEIALVKMGLDVDSADSLAEARRFLLLRDYALVLTDMRLLDGLGIELVHEIVASGKMTPVAVITAFGSADNAVMALKAGAFDYLSKPVALDQLRLMVQSALRVHLPERNGVPPAGILPRNGLSNNKSGAPALRLIGVSAAMQDLRTQIARLARSMAPIAISGESGSGKELAARDLHALSPRADKPFIAVNCGAIPENLMEAEFFGYRKGAFTGAADDRDGFFQAANGGTLLLDEVADLPLAMQVKLLRAIQERRVRKVGATTEEVVDVRLVSATHQNLAECVEKGKFRQDLYYRLNVIELHLPPLRERVDDIGLLAEVILTRLAFPDQHQSPISLSPAALQALRGYTFPGNVRELENILERALAFANDGQIEVSDLALRAPGYRQTEAARAIELREPIGPEESAATVAAIMAMGGQFVIEPDDTKVSLPPSLPMHLDDVERNIIRQALGRTQFNRTKAAELLGISFRQLRYRMQRLSIHEQE